jgi:hypothetical protein
VKPFKVGQPIHNIEDTVFGFRDKKNIHLRPFSEHAQGNRLTNPSGIDLYMMVWQDFTNTFEVPGFMADWKRERQLRKSGDSSEVVITKYTLTTTTAREIKKVAPLYGSQGRALQVATEMLIRMENPPAPEPESEQPPPMIRVSMRIRKRTYELIRNLSQLKYNEDPGQVIAACVKVLKMKKIKL